MVRKCFFLALSASALFSLANQARAQIVLPGLPQVPRIQAPKIGGLPADLQQQLEQLLDPALVQRQGFQRPDGHLRWGGLRLKKATAEMQTDLGLPENEGLVVAGLDPNSVAEKAGLKLNDVLVKINNKSVPNDVTGLAKVIKEQKPEEALDLVVVRNGKEETIKGAKMPLVVQAAPDVRGGGLVRPGIPGIAFPRIQINPGRVAPVNPFQPAVIQNLELEMTVNGAKIVRKQKGNEFSGEWSKDELKITVAGKVENAQGKPSEITVQEGKESKKYATLQEMPAQYRMVTHYLIPSPVNNMMMFPVMPNIPNAFELPGLFPELPGFEN